MVCSKYYGKGLRNAWMLFDGRGREISFYPKKEFETIASYTARRMFREKSYFLKIEKIVRKKKEDALKFIGYLKNKNFSNLNFPEQMKIIEKIKKLWISYDEASIQAWFIGGDKFAEMLFEDLNISEKDFGILTTPEEKTQASRFEYEFIKKLKLIKSKKVNIEKAAQLLSDKYGWLPFVYDGPTYWDKEYFIKKLEKESKRDLKKIDKEVEEIELKDKNSSSGKRKLVDKYNLKKDQLERIRMINVMTNWTDDRKMLDYQLNYYFRKILEAIGEKNNIPIGSLKALFTEEIEKILNDPKKYLKESSRRIADDFLVEYKNGKHSIVSGEKKKRILRSIRKIPKTSKITGVVASKGPRSIYTGTAKIILSVGSKNEVEKGDFLVANMTTPNYIVQMRKAKGFITDEGGVTCHAAIVAREMNKPCIIGTKIATKVLKDGDLVEVDANKGVVKIIKKA